MSASSNLTFLLLVCAVLAGCAAMPANHSSLVFTEQTLQQDEFAQDDNLDDLMRYHNFLQEKNAFQLSWEYNYAKNHYKNNTNAESRLKYILLISLPNTAFTDIHGALDLLENWPEDVTISPNLASFKKLLTTLLTEQQTARLNARNLLQKLKTSEELVQTLQNRIDAIKSIQRNPIRRTTPE